MIELTQGQRQTLQDGKPVRVRENGQEYVLLRPDVYQRLVEEEDNNGNWTPEELNLLRAESVALLDRYGKDA